MGEEIEKLLYDPVIGKFATALATKGQVKFASATFQLVEVPDFTVKIKS